MVRWRIASHSRPARRDCSVAAWPAAAAPGVGNPSGPPAPARTATDALWPARIAEIVRDDGLSADERASRAADDQRRPHGEDEAQATELTASSARQPKVACEAGGCRCCFAVQAAAVAQPGPAVAVRPSRTATRADYGPDRRSRRRLIPWHHGDAWPCPAFGRGLAAELPRGGCRAVLAPPQPNPDSRTSG
jgi:hypothetical protein